MIRQNGEKDLVESDGLLLHRVELEVQFMTGRGSETLLGVEHILVLVQTDHVVGGHSDDARVTKPWKEEVNLFNLRKANKDQKESPWLLDARVVGLERFFSFAKLLQAKCQLDSANGELDKPKS